MKGMLRYCVGAYGLLLALVLPAWAEQKDDYEKDARYAENTPPMIPHRVPVNATGEVCLACHRSGVNGAPLSPHPVRIDCVQCHGQGELKKRSAQEKPKKSTKHTH